MTLSNQPRGYAWVSITVLAYLASNVLVQSLIQSRLQYSNMWIVALLGNLPSLCLFAIHYKNGTPTYARDYLLKAIPMAFISLLSSVSYNSALAFARLSTVTVLTSTAAIFSLAFELLLLRETTVRPLTVASAFISTFGCAVVSTDVVDPEVTGNSNDGVGVSLALLSALLQGLFSVLLKTYGITDFTFFLPCMSLVVLATGPITLGVQSIIGNFMAPSAIVYLAILLNGTLGVAGNFSQMKAIETLSPVVVNVAMTTLIPVSILWDAVAKEKMPSAIFVVGASIVLGATALVAFAPGNPSEEVSGSDLPTRSLVPDEIAEITSVSRDREPLLTVDPIISGLSKHSTTFLS